MFAGDGGDGTNLAAALEPREFFGVLAWWLMWRPDAIVVACGVGAIRVQMAEERGEVWHDDGTICTTRAIH